MSENALRRPARAFLRASRVIAWPLNTTVDAKISSITFSFCWFHTSSKKRRTIALFCSSGMPVSFRGARLDHERVAPERPAFSQGVEGRLDFSEGEEPVHDGSDPPAGHQVHGLL